MSKHETPMTLAYWESVGGTLIEEYEIVSARRGVQGHRRVDGLILVDGPRSRMPAKAVTLAGLRDRDVLLVQTKCHRLGTYLLGQAAFSPLLLEQSVSPRSIQSVAVCAASDPVLEQLAAEHNVKVVVQSGHPIRAEPKSPSRAFVNQYWKRVGGTLIPKYPLGTDGDKAGLHAEALILLDGLHEELPAGTRVPLDDREVVVVASAGGGIGFGMYVTGAAYFSRILVEGQHQARSVRAVALVPREDAVMRRLYSSLDRIEAVVMPRE